jgi:hypothetical protein
MVKIDTNGKAEIVPEPDGTVDVRQRDAELRCLEALSNGVMVPFGEGGFLIISGSSGARLKRELKRKRSVQLKVPVGKTGSLTISGASASRNRSALDALKDCTICVYPTPED